MIIKNCALYNFRNYEKQEIEFHRGTNLFYGENAQGKTNILEAVYLCGTTKSHRGSKDREMIRFGSEEAHIQMNAEKNDIPFRVDMHLKKNASKGIAVNRVPIKKASELLGMTKFVFFSPEDLNIIKNGPRERRRFMDSELCQLNRIYYLELAKYNRVIAQRNRLLKDMPFSPDPSQEAMLDELEQRMGEMIRVQESALEKALAEKEQASADFQMEQQAIEDDIAGLEKLLIE